MASLTQKPTFTVRRATLLDLPSLATIVPRSFHPTNPYILKLFPDTALLQQWWTKIWTSKLQHPSTSHLLTVVNANDPSKTLGVLSMQLLAPDKRGAGFYTSFPPTSDHDAQAYGDVAAGLAGAREGLMMGRAHFVIELLGVDHDVKGYGLGKQLLLKACEVADAAGLPIFVMANASAQGIYPKVGFELRDVKVLPVELQYEEYMLVRPVGGARRERIGRLDCRQSLPQHARSSNAVCHVYFIFSDCL